MNANTQKENTSDSDEKSCLLYGACRHTSLSHCGECPDAKPGEVFGKIIEKFKEKK